MYHAGSVHRIEDITEPLWGSKMFPSTISKLNKKAYVYIEDRRDRPLQDNYPYVYVDDIYLCRRSSPEGGLAVSVKPSSIQQRRIQGNLDTTLRIKNQFALHSAGAFQGSNSWTFSGWVRSISAAIDISQDK